MGLDLNDLVSIRTTVNSFLTDSVTNSRTNAVLTCRINYDRREVHMDGVPPPHRLQRFQVMFPDRTDIRLGDALTTADKGTYSVIEVGAPDDFSTSTMAYAVQIRRQDGSIPILYTHKASFRRTSPPAETTPQYDVAIEWISPEALVNEGGFSYKLLATWDAAIAFSNGQPIGEGHQLVSPILKNGSAGLSYVRHFAVVPVACAYIQDA